MELRIGFGNDYDSVKTYHSETLPMQATLGDATIHVSATFKPSLDDSAANLYIYLVIKNPAAVVGGVAQSILDYIRVRNVMLEGAAQWPRCGLRHLPILITSPRHLPRTPTSTAAW